MFTWNVDLGTILSLVAFLASGFYFVFSMQGSIGTLKAVISGISKEREKEHTDNLSKFNEIEDQLEKLTEVLTTLAVQKEQIRGMDKKISELDAKLEKALEKALIAPKASSSRSRSR